MAAHAVHENVRVRFVGKVLLNSLVRPISVTDEDLKSLLDHRVETGFHFLRKPGNLSRTRNENSGNRHGSLCPRHHKRPDLGGATLIQYFGDAPQRTSSFPQIIDEQDALTLDRVRTGLDSLRQ